MCTCRLLPWTDPDRVRMHRRACAVMGLVHGVKTIDGTARAPWMPNRRGHVYWLWMWWIGVPKPIRWAYPVIRWWLDLPPLSGPLEGCGCIRRLRAWWYSRAWRRRLRA